jgi:hypothetical protein
MHVCGEQNFVLGRLQQVFECSQTPTNKTRITLSTEIRQRFSTASRCYPGAAYICGVKRVVEGERPSLFQLSSTSGTFLSHAARSRDIATTLCEPLRKR